MRRSAVKERMQKATGSSPVNGEVLVDASLWPKFAVKGPNAAQWLYMQDVSVPEAIYHTVRLNEHDLIARTGSDEFVVQSQSESGLTDRLSQTCLSGEGVWPYAHEAATFLLTGLHAIEIWSQTCGVDFAEQRIDRILYTRVAGVSCAILPEVEIERVRYRIWVPVSYAVYFWEIMNTI